MERKSQKNQKIKYGLSLSSSRIPIEIHFNDAQHTAFAIDLFS